MKFTLEQKRHFYEHGFVRVANVIPRDVVDQALRAINHSIGEGIDPNQVTTLRARSYCPELSDSPVITDLFNKTPAFTLAESITEKGRLNAVGNGQIALRFPSLDNPTYFYGAHVDGMYTPHNGVEKGKIRNFTMLVSVLLSDIPNPNSGNLTVWPGTHHLHEKYFQEHGAESLLNGMPPIERPEPYEVTGMAGDVIFAHWALAHSIGHHKGPNIRYAVFYRAKHVEHDLDWKAPMTNIWLHYPELRESLDLSK